MARVAAERQRRRADPHTRPSLPRKRGGAPRGMWRSIDAVSSCAFLLGEVEAASPPPMGDAHFQPVGGLEDESAEGDSYDPVTGEAIPLDGNSLTQQPAQLQHVAVPPPPPPRNSPVTVPAVSQPRSEPTGGGACALAKDDDDGEVSDAMAPEASADASLANSRMGQASPASVASSSVGMQPCVGVSAAPTPAPRAAAHDNPNDGRGRPASDGCAAPESVPLKGSGGPSPCTLPTRRHKPAPPLSLIALAAGGEAGVHSSDPGEVLRREASGGEIKHIAVSPIGDASVDLYDRLQASGDANASHAGATIVIKPAAGRHRPTPPPPELYPGPSMLGLSSLATAPQHHHGFRGGGRGTVVSAKVLSGPQPSVTRLNRPMTYMTAPPTPPPLRKPPVPAQARRPSQRAPPTRGGPRGPYPTPGLLSTGCALGADACAASVSDVANATLAWRAPSPLATLHGDGAQAARLSTQMLRTDSLHTGLRSGVDPDWALLASHRWVFSPAMLLSAYVETTLAPLPLAADGGDPPPGVAVSGVAADASPHSTSLVCRHEHAAPGQDAAGTTHGVARPHSAPSSRKPGPVEAASRVGRATRRPTSASSPQRATSPRAPAAPAAQGGPLRRWAACEVPASNLDAKDCMNGDALTHQQQSLLQSHPHLQLLTPPPPPPPPQQQQPQQPQQPPQQTQSTVLLAMEQDVSALADVLAVRMAVLRTPSSEHGAALAGHTGRGCGVSHGHARSRTAEGVDGGAGPWPSVGLALSAFHALRNLVLGANRRASECVQLGHFSRAERLLKPVLDVLHVAARQHGWPALLLQNLAAVNAASLCGVLLANGKPGAAWQAGTRALDLEARSGNGDNPVGLRIAMASVAFTLSRTAACISLLRQAARIGLMQLRALQLQPAPRAAPSAPLATDQTAPDQSTGTPQTSAAFHGCNDGRGQPTTVEPGAGVPPMVLAGSDAARDGTDLRPLNANRYVQQAASDEASGDAQHVSMAHVAMDPHLLNEKELGVWLRAQLTRPTRTANTPPTCATSVSSDLQRAESYRQAFEQPADAALARLEARLGDRSRYAGISEEARLLIEQQLQRAMIVVYLQLGRCFRSQGRLVHWASALHHAAHLCEAGGAPTANLLPRIRAMLDDAKVHLHKDTGGSVKRPTYRSAATGAGSRSPVPRRPPPVPHPLTSAR